MDEIYALVNYHPFLDESMKSKNIQFWSLTIPGSRYDLVILSYTVEWHTWLLSAY